jgi:hypothetical protein
MKGEPMHAHKDDLPVKIDAPGAKARVLPDFGDASAYRAISGEYFSLAAGADIAPLLEGLTDDLCDAPHWGFLLEGALTVTYATGEEETITGGELFYWPPGHSIRVGADAEVILFSPQAEHTKVLDHMLHKMGAAASPA